MNSEDHGRDSTGTLNTTQQPEPARAPSRLVPELSDTQHKDVSRRTQPSAVVVHETVREEGEQELQRAPAALGWSALAAGLSMGFSLIAQGLIHFYLHGVSWSPLLDNFGYSVGFLIAVLGRQQLFTENTLTPILPLFANHSLRMLWLTLRLWTIVLAANLVGAFIFAFILAHTSLFPGAIQKAFAQVAQNALRGGFGLTILRAIFAGWLIALMVWLLPAAEGTRLHVIIILTYLVSLGGFAHIIAGSIDVLYLVNLGAATWGTYFIGFMLPTLIGNIIGGVSLVAALNFAQVASEKIGDD